MDPLLDSGIQFILWLQSLGAWLKPVMQFFTFLGAEQFYLMVAPAIIWCVDSTLGMRLGIFLMINGMVNSIFKMALHNPRPYWFSSEISVTTSAENSFGVPSGHAQNSIVIWGTIAERIKRTWAWIIAIFIMFMIGLSRLYLGVHFPLDVIVGWVIGILVLLLLLRFERPVVEWIKKYRPSRQILIIFLFSLGIVLILWLIQLSMSGWSLPPDWVSNALLVFPDEPAITPFSLHNVISPPAAFFGLAAGWIWVSSRGGFSVQGEWWKLLIRYLLGVAGVMIVYTGLGSIFPRDETIIAYALRFLRYALIGAWISGFAPWIFIRLKLANKIY